MGLMDVFRRWTKGEDERALRRAEEESRMTPAERAFDSEDFEGHKDDVAALNTRTGSEAAETAADDLDLPRP